jgi:hypothetical protein
MATGQAKSGQWRWQCRWGWRRRQQQREQQQVEDVGNAGDIGCADNDGCNKGVQSNTGCNCGEDGSSEGNGGGELQVKGERWRIGSPSASLSNSTSQHLFTGLHVHFCRRTICRCWTGERAGCREAGVGAGGLVAMTATA